MLERKKQKHFNLMVNYLEHIEVNPEKRFGRPVIKGTRITVYDMLNFLANGQQIEEILDDFPELTQADIKACLAYAADKESRLRIAS